MTNSPRLKPARLGIFLIISACLFLLVSGRTESKSHNSLGLRFEEKFGAQFVRGQYDVVFGDVFHTIWSDVVALGVGFSIYRCGAGTF